ncbi:MAG: hypothetical protein R2830_16560 [Saprospiraceae bacterium]
MQKNQLIQCLGHLDRKAMTRFSEFARSPYFNKHQDVQNLVAYLSQIYPDFTDKKCDRAVVFQHLYPTLPHNQARLAIVFTYATRLLEKFLIAEQAISEGLLHDGTLLSRYQRQHGFLFLFEKTWPENVGGGTFSAAKNMPANPGEIPTLTSAYYEKKYKEAAERDAATISLARPGIQFLWEKQAWLNAFYLTEKLRDACEMAHRKKLLNTSLPDDPMLEAALQAISGHLHEFAPYPPLMAYFHLFQLLQPEETAQYPSTLKKIKEYEPGLAREEVQNIYNSLQNYCIGQINQGNQPFLRELFGIYRSQLDKGLLLVDGHLPEWHFKNITTTGLRLDEHRWVKKFLESYKSLLPESVAVNAYSYNLAAYHYHLKNYDEVLRLLLKIEYTDLRYNLDAKSLLLRTYFDLEEEDALKALTESFKQYLKRSRQLSDFQKKGYFNLLKFSQKAFNLKVGKGYTAATKWSNDLQKLKKEMAAATAIFNQSWLESKVAEL